MQKLIRSLGVPFCLVFAFLAGACADPMAPTQNNVVKSASVIPSLGYNTAATMFVGTADESDGVVDGLYYGSPFFAKDNLVSNWSNDYWTGAVGSWIQTHWNGKVPGGSGDVWHYKIVKLGYICGPDGSPLPGGGFCYGQSYAVIMSQGTILNDHFWLAHGRPNGLGG